MGRNSSSQMPAVSPAQCCFFARRDLASRTRRSSSARMGRPDGTAGQPPAMDNARRDATPSWRHVGELADVVVCPSAYMRRWCKDQHSRSGALHRSPERARRRGPPLRPAADVPRRVNKIVFFGQDRMPQRDRSLSRRDRPAWRAASSDFEVVILGSFVPPTRRSELTRLGRRLAVRDARLRPTTRATKRSICPAERAIALPCFASRVDNSPYTVYECLENAIPFIATNVGGVAELIREEDR